jgi:hypothetical protein
VFLRGGDADARLRELVHRRARVRPVLGELSVALLERKRYEALGFRSLGDWSRERVGCGARTVREWARVGRGLAGLPRLREAVLEGEISWTVARKVVAHTTPESEVAVLATVRGRTVRAVETLLQAAFPPEPSSDTDDTRTSVRVSCSPEVATKWVAACELARRVSGENLSTWECAEAIAAECAAARSVPPDVPPRAPERRRPRRGPRAGNESGHRALVWPHLGWRHPAALQDDPLRHLTRDLDGCSPRALDRRFRRAIAFLQEVDLEIGRVLKQVVDRNLYRELGFESFDRYVEERVDLSPRTARRLVRLARAEHTAEPVASAFREGRITLLQAEVLLRGPHAGWLQEAHRITLRRLEDELPQRRVEFSAPTEVAALFCALADDVGLEAMLDHAIATWLQAGRAFRDYADFERDGFRCTVPACSARRNLHSHHIRFRSAGGPDEPWNRTTLCAFHHERGVHTGAIGIRGQAPHELTYLLGVGRFRSGDIKLEANMLDAGKRRGTMET